MAGDPSSSTEFGKTADCPEDSEIQSFLEDRLTRQRDAEVERHIELCDRCRTVLESVIRGDWLGAAPTTRSGEFATRHLPIIEGYELLEKVGTGGQGVVYKAIESHIDRYVAIKMLKDETLAGPKSIRRLSQEARAAGRMSHPHIVRVLSVREAGRYPAIVMEWVGGGTLSDRLKAGKIRIKDAVPLMIDIADAVACAHENGVLHRDIKPANILFDDAGFRKAKLTDFGLAKLRRAEGDWSTTADMVGSPHYMSPEAISSEHGSICPGSDLYSIGAVLYHILTGRAPFTGVTAMETIYLSLNRDPIPPRVNSPDIPADLETICLKCLKKDPAERYMTAAELRDDLKRFSEGRPIAARRDGRVKKAKLWVRRNPRLAAVSSAFVGLLVVAVITLSVFLNRARFSEKQFQEQARIAEANLELARASELKAGQRLSDTIKVLGLSTPIFKRFLEDLSLSKLELRRIEEFEKLCRTIAADSKDPVERLKFHYVTLELGNALWNVVEKKNEAIEWTRVARENIALFLKVLDDETGMINSLEQPQEFVYTLREKAHIQYAHSCIQLFQFLGGGRVKSTNDPLVELAYEAIEHARIALASNPELDEAKGDLSNYLMEIARAAIVASDFQSAKRLTTEALTSSRELLKTYYSDPARWRFVLAELNFLAGVMINCERDSEGYLAILDQIEALLDEPRKAEIPAWNEISADILFAIQGRFRVLYLQGKNAEALAAIDSVLDRLTSRNEHPFKVVSRIEALNQLRLERLSLLKLTGKPDDMLREEHLELQSLFESLEDPHTKATAIAALSLLTPVEELRDPVKAAHVLATIEVDDEFTLRLKSYCRTAVTATMPGEPESAVSVDEDHGDTTNRTDLMKQAFDAEACIRSGRLEQARKLLAEAREAFVVDSSLAMSFYARLEELEKKSTMVLQKPGQVIR